MKKKMLYVKPGLKGLSANADAYCSTGSGASAGSGTMCQEGSTANYCSTGNVDGGEVCAPSGVSPSSGMCAPGQSADGWAVCDEGGAVGMACNEGNSPV